MAQLKRSMTNRMIGGVAGGIAEHFGFDPSAVRVAWVVAVLFGGFGFLLYIILWIVLPEGDDSPPAIRVAEERFARGEITVDELNQIRRDLAG